MVGGRQVASSLLHLRTGQHAPAVLLPHQLEMRRSSVAGDDSLVEGVPRSSLGGGTTTMVVVVEGAAANECAKRTQYESRAQCVYYPRNNDSRLLSASSISGSTSPPLSRRTYYDYDYFDSSSSSHTEQ